MSSRWAGSVPRSLLVGAEPLALLSLLAHAACGESPPPRLSGPQEVEQHRSRIAASNVIDPAIVLRTGVGAVVRRSPDTRVEGVRVVAGSGVSLVLWYETGPQAADPAGAVRAIRVGADGTLADPAPFVVDAHDRGAADAAFDGVDHFLVAYEDADRFQGGGVHARRVRASDGAVLDDPELVLSAPGSSADSPTVAYGDGRFLIVWRSSAAVGTKIRGRFLLTTGSTTSPTDFAIAPGVETKRLPVTCFTAGYFLVAYQAQTAVGHQLRAQRVRASDGAILDEGASPIATSPTAMGRPRCASDGSGFVVTWDTGPAAPILGRRIDAASGAPVGPVETLARGLGPQLVFDGTAFVLLWTDVRGVYIRHVAPNPLSPRDGPVDSGGIAIATSTVASQEAQDLDLLGSTAFITWQRYGPATHLLGVRARVSDGALLDASPRALVSHANPQSDAAVAFAGGVYFVAWFDRRRGDGFPSPTDMVGARIRASDGAILDPLGLSLIDDVESPSGPPAIATDGSGFLVGAVRKTGPDTADLLVRRVLVDGTLPDPAELTIQRGMTVDRLMGPNVSAAGAGTRYVVAWPHFAADPMLGVVSREIHAQLVDSVTGALVGSPIVVGSSTNDLCTEPTVACERQTCLVAWLDGDGAQRTATNVFGGRINIFTGSALDTTPIHLDERAGNPRYTHFALALAERAGSYFVIWTELSGRGIELMGRPLGADGSILGSPVTTLGSSCSADIRSISAVFDGDQIFSFCSSQQSTVFARLRPPGTLLDPSMRLVATTSLSVSRPRSASDGSGSTMAVHTRFDLSPELFTSRVVADLFDRSADGGRLDASPMLDATSVPDGGLVLDAQPDAEPDAQRDDDGGVLLDGQTIDALEIDTSDGSPDATPTSSEDSSVPSPSLEPVDPGPTCGGCNASGRSHASLGPSLALLVGLLATRWPRRPG